MQKLMNSQLDDPDKTITRREIKARVKTEFQRLIPYLAENLTFNSLSGPGSFKTTFYDRKRYEITHSWKSLLYEATNLAYSNNLKGVFNAVNDKITKHNDIVTMKALNNKHFIGDDQLIATLEEKHINRSYYTHLNSKGALLACTVKGIYASWPEMNSSKNMEKIPKIAERR
jgi:hypothetical protein